MSRTMSILILAVLSFDAAHAQAPSPPPTFDVASVKPSPSTGADLININLGNLNHGVVTLANTTLSECIRYAYGLVSEDQIDGPDWIRDRSLRVDITAKTSPDTPIDRVRPMMQTLLSQRFHLELHREPKPLRHFVLVASPKGLKLPESPEGGPVGRITYNRGRLLYNHVPLGTLAVLLSRQLKQPVLDLTGLPGFYDIHLEWTPDDQPPNESADAPLLPDIFHAIEEQLGLQLEPKKTPIDVLVIDRADKVPIAN